MTPWVVPLALVAAWALTGWILRRAEALRLIDLPNERSSHSRPTPRGGGVAIAVVGTVMVALQGLGADRFDAGLVSIALGGALIATLGFVDDRYGLSAGLRIAVQAAVVAAAVAAVGGAPDEVLTVIPWGTPWAGHLLCILVVLWFLNLFNFMDGIDGIAASQGVFMPAGAAVLCALHGASLAEVSLFGGVAAAVMGFLIWNRPPARIFMGDSGSAYLGFLLPMLSLWVSIEAPMPVWGLIVLGTLFIGDASATLLRRTLSGYRWSDAHRSHVYQRLARRFGHARVTLGYTFVNLVVVFPLAWMTIRHREHGALIACAAVSISIVAFWRLGAGRSEAQGA